MRPESLFSLDDNPRIRVPFSEDLRDKCEASFTFPDFIIERVFRDGSYFEAIRIYPVDVPVSREGVIMTGSPPGIQAAMKTAEINIARKKKEGENPQDQSFTYAAGLSFLDFSKLVIPGINDKKVDQIAIHELATVLFEDEMVLVKGFYGGEIIPPLKFSEQDIGDFGMYLFALTLTIGKKMNKK